jgi:hypothetical protein
VTWLDNNDNPIFSAVTWLDNNDKPIFSAVTWLDEYRQASAR